MYITMAILDVDNTDNCIIKTVQCVYFMSVTVVYKIILTAWTNRNHQ